MVWVVTSYLRIRRNPATIALVKLFVYVIAGSNGFERVGPKSDLPLFTIPHFRHIFPNFWPPRRGSPFSNACDTHRKVKSSLDISKFLGHFLVPPSSLWQLPFSRSPPFCSLSFATPLVCQRFFASSFAIVWIRWIASFRPHLPSFLPRFVWFLHAFWNLPNAFLTQNPPFSRNPPFSPPLHYLKRLEEILNIQSKSITWQICQWSVQIVCEENFATRGISREIEIQFEWILNESRVSHDIETKFAFFPIRTRFQPNLILNMQRTT